MFTSEPLELLDRVGGARDVDRPGELGPHPAVRPRRGALPHGRLLLQQNEPFDAGQRSGHRQADRPSPNDRGLDPLHHRREHRGSRASRTW